MLENEENIPQEGDQNSAAEILRQAGITVPEVRPNFVNKLLKNYRL